MIYNDDNIVIASVWKNIKATVCRHYEIPHSIATQTSDPRDIPVRTLFGNDLCLKQSTNINRLAIVPFLPYVKEGQVTFTLVVNFTANLIKIKHRPKLGEFLLHDRKVVSKSLESPTAYFGKIGESTLNTGRGLGTSLDLAVKVVDYLDIKPRLRNSSDNTATIWLFLG